MRKLKSYILFKEEIEVKLTDEPALKMAKEKLNTLTKQIAEYKTKKILVDKAYLTSKTDADLKIAIDNIVGKTDVGPKEDRNPFLVEYLAIATFKRQIDQLQKSITEDKIKNDDFTQNLKTGGSKEAIGKKMSEITKRIGTNTATIASLKRDIDTYQKKLNDKMSKVQKDMNDYIKIISSKTQK